DPQTEVVGLVSKPTHPDVAARVLDVAAGGNKPVVVIFLGAQSLPTPTGDGKVQPLTYARTLEEAAQLAVRLAGGSAFVTADDEVREVTAPFSPGQKYVRGLFSGV